MFLFLLTVTFNWSSCSLLFILLANHLSPFSTEGQNKARSGITQNLFPPHLASVKLPFIYLIELLNAINVLIIDCVIRNPIEWMKG